MLPPSVLQLLPRSPAVQGMLWMLASAATGTFMSTAIRLAAEELHPMQVAFFRCVFGVLYMTPWLIRAGIATMRTTRMQLYWLRAAVAALSLLSWFYAVSRMPIAEATALGFTTPLFATMGAAFILNETVRLRRWSATIAGFLGVLLIVRPGMHDIGWPASLALFSSVTAAGSVMLIKTLARTEAANAIVTYTMLYLTPMTLIPALMVWQTPSWRAIGLCVLVGVVGTSSNLCQTRAFACADASAVLPIDYIRLPFVALIGYLAFAEVPDQYVWLGGAVIAGSAIYIARREAQLARAAAQRLPTDTGGRVGQ
jgi:drug/metabolite transporter (DMT)-like permease